MQKLSAEAGGGVRPVLVFDFGVGRKQVAGPDTVTAQEFGLGSAGAAERGPHCPTPTCSPPRHFFSRYRETSK